MDLSSEPDAIVDPSGLHDSVDMPARWPSNVCMSFPDDTFHTFIVASAPSGSIHHSISSGPEYGALLSGKSVGVYMPTTAGNHSAIRRELGGRHASLVASQHKLLLVM